MVLYDLYVKIENTVSNRPVGRMQVPQRVNEGEIIIYANKAYKILKIRYNVVNSNETKCELLMEEIDRKWGIL